MKCLEVMDRVSPMASPHPSNDDAYITEDLDCDGLSNPMGEISTEISELI